MIAPTSEERIQNIAKNARGFIYVVSSMGVTGMRSEIKTDLNALLSSIKKATDVPACVGFGIHSPEQAAEVARVADGVIVGSAIVKMAEQYGGHAAPHMGAYVHKMKMSLSD